VQDNKDRTLSPETVGLGLFPGAHRCPSFCILEEGRKRRQLRGGCFIIFFKKFDFFFDGYQKSSQSSEISTVLFLSHKIMGMLREQFFNLMVLRSNHYIELWWLTTLGRLRRPS